MWEMLEYWSRWGDAGLLLLEEEPSGGNAAHPANMLPLDENVKC